MSESRSEESRLNRQELLIGAAGLAAAGLGFAGSASGAVSSDAAVDGLTSEAVKRGGRLRVGFTGAGQAESLSPLNTVADIDFGRAWNLFDNFVRPGPNGAAENALVESFEHNKNASVWTIRFKDGVEWHDGKPLTADDGMYTMRYVGRPGSESLAAIIMKPIDLKRLKKLDKRTFRIPMHTPIATLPDWLQVIGLSVVQNGATKFDKPIGTGPFRFVSWKKGQSSLFERNPNYWDHPRPYIDKLEFQSLPDPTTRLQALLSGQLDAIHDLPAAQAKQYANSGKIRVLIAQTSGMVPITMSVDEAPFKDVRVRQAFRFAADRGALVDNVTFGYGSVGNDIYGRGLPFYDHNLPQRVQDIDKAKSLLKAAGQEGVTVQLNTSSAAVGMLESATLYAQQAAKAGINVKLKQYPADSYFNPPYLKWAFGQDYWPLFSIPAMFALGLTSKAPFNETHWRRRDWDKLFFDALGDVSHARAQQKWYALQKTLYNEGGYIIWGTTAWIDGISRKIRGAAPNAYFGLDAMRFEKWWFA